jgi:hypothetical protein
VIADRRLWLTADREQVVEEGDPSAAFLFATPGKEVSDADAERYGLKASKAKPAETQQAEPAEEKQAAEPANKARKRTANKSK